MENASIKVLGIAPRDLTIKFKSALDIHKGIQSNELVVFCDYSEFDIPIDYIFKKVKFLDSNLLVNCYSCLKRVTQEHGIPYELIPKGHKTICKFEIISSGTFHFMEKLSIVNSWYESESYVIFL